MHKGYLITILHHRIPYTDALNFCDIEISELLIINICSNDYDG